MIDLIESFPKINLEKMKPYLFIIVFIIAIGIYFNSLNKPCEPFKDDEDDNKQIKLDLFNCKKKLKSCTRTTLNTSWDNIKNMKNKATIQYYLDECNDILTKNNC